MMKKICFLLFFGLVSHLGIAQQPELINTDWYNYKLTIEGTDYIAPLNNERLVWTKQGAEFKFNHSSNEFESYYCSSRTYQNISFQGMDRFMVTNQVDLPQNNCQDKLNMVHAETFFKVMNFPLGQSVLYTINIVNQNDMELILEFPNGDKAYFYNSVLSVKSNEFSNVTVFPNPVSDVMTIDLSSVAEKKFVFKIFDVSGKVVKQVDLKSGDVLRLDISDLSQGNYMIHIVNDKGVSELMDKIVKK